MSRRIETPEDAWTRFSISKDSAFMSCPLRGALDYIVPEWSPLNPYAAQGIALHGLFERFFRRHPSTLRFPYDTPKKFIGAWFSLWKGATAGEHGFRGKGKPHDRNPIEQVRWDYDDQADHLLQKGISITAIFHQRFHDQRHDGLYRRVEAGFGFHWEGLYVTGIIDRIDRRPDGAVVVDYKSKDHPIHDLQTGIQMTMYQLAYEQVFRRQRHWQVPLKGIEIYNYKGGTTQQAPLRPPEEFGLLLRFKKELAAYIRGVCTGKLSPSESTIGFRHFDPRDIERGDMTPRLPRGDHCGFCRHYVACRQWELGRRPTIRALYKQRWEGTPARNVRQRPFRTDPIIIRGTKTMRAIQARNAVEQLELEL